MKILFVTFSPLAFDVQTPEREPLGGTESCICYLARQLAANGHDVTLIANQPAGGPQRISGVRHWPQEAMDDSALIAGENFDVAISISNPMVPTYLRGVAPGTLNFAWMHTFPDDTVSASLNKAASDIDCAVFVSNSQREAYRYQGAADVIGNAIAPAFENLFGSAAELRTAKQNRAIYTSMPFRGLDLLVAVMERSSATELDIYSAMRTYQESDDQFRPLYDRAKMNPRVRYHTPIAQTELAERMKQVAYLAYPCTFIETYCIAAVEAIAAGLKVITTDLGPLADTCMGFADLLPRPPGIQNLDIVTGFVMLLEKNVAAFKGAPDTWAEERFAQMQAVNQHATWRARAAQWEALLGRAVAAKRG